MDEPGVINVSRQELYDQVWSTPVSDLCHTYGLSDVGLAKFCASWNIPRPPRGYWAKKQSGKHVVKKQLKPIEEGNPIILSYQPQQTQQTEADRSSTESERQRSYEKRPENRILVQEQLVAPHLLVSRTEKSIRNAKPNEAGICRPQARRCLDVAVSPALIDRALRICDAILKAVEARDMAVSVGDSDQPRTEVKVFEERVGFQLYEETKRRERNPTEEEKKEDVKGERYQHLWPIRPRYERVPTGKLVLQITDGFGLRRCWTDRSDRRVEQFLNSFVVGLVRAAETIKQGCIEAERQRKAREEQERQRQEQEERRRVEERLQRAEEARFQKLEAEVAAWAKAQQIRAYLTAVRAVQEKNGGIAAGGELERWLNWAAGRADGLDPKPLSSEPTAGR